MKILFIEDDNSQRKLLSDFLRKKEFSITTAENGEKGIAEFDKNPYDLIITDYRMPGLNGLDVVRYVKNKNPLTAILVVTAYSDVNDAVTVIKEGADDYILKPLNLDELLMKIKKAENRINTIKESNTVLESIKHDFYSEKIVGKSPAFRDILSIVDRVADSSASILITGESGTGKEVISELLHKISPRRKNKLVIVNCAALPDNLLESELFGHVKGAFTGAVKDRPGRFDEADGGTLFLDEIGEISGSIQVKLLRVLQNMSFEPVGSSTTKHVDVRIIAATNKNLEDEVFKGNFREDLYYRLNVVPIHMPALRERKEDIPLLIDFFLKEFNKFDEVKFSHEALMKMVSYKWEGNIRQLKNIVMRIVTLTRNSTIMPSDLPPQFLNIKTPEKNEARTLSEVERSHILSVLNSVKGNRIKAAEILGIHRNTLTRKIKEYGIE